MTQTQVYQLQVQVVKEYHGNLDVTILLSNGKQRTLRLSAIDKDNFIQAIEFTIPRGVSYCLADLSQVTGNVHVSCETPHQYTNWCFYWPGSVTAASHSNTGFSGEYKREEYED